MELDRISSPYHHVIAGLDKRISKLLTDRAGSDYSNLHVWSKLPAW
jgi:hypothetical protein